MTQENKLTEPVQVGLWYQTKAGAIVKIDENLMGNNHVFYNTYGRCVYASHQEHEIIKCLGADPFNQRGFVSNIDVGSKTEITTPTLHDQVAMAALQGLLAGAGTHALKHKWFYLKLAFEYTDEFMRHKNERENG